MDKDILADARDAFAQCVEEQSEQRDRMLDDLRFARLGEQWPDKVKKDRQAEGRPCLTINRMPAFIRQVVNDARQNKPSIKVLPVDSGADRQTADIFSGLIRNIESVSSADVAYDTGIDHAATMGIGYWRIALEYACDDAFDLDLRIKRISNPFTVYGDPASTEADSSDWNLGFVTEMMPGKAFKKKYPDAEETSWEGDRDKKDQLWFESDSVRVAEYWTREEVEKKLLLLSDGTAMREEDFLAIDETGLSARDIAYAQGITVARERMTKSYKVMQRIITGSEVLEETLWAGIYIPIVPVYGEEINVEGKRYFFSLVHHATDAQRMFNFWRTATTELVALAPKNPYIGRKGAFSADPEKWATAHVKSHPHIEYDGSEMPQRQPFAGPPAGALQEALNAADDMKSILGMFDASLGARSNETSGRAIMARQREGDTSTFHFIDNLTRSIRHTGRILLDLIPHAYSKRKMIRVLGEDGTPQSVEINQAEPLPDGTMRRINDVTAGKYDLTVSSGPGFNTRREEAAYQMTEMIRSNPEAAPVIGPHLAKNLDWPGADQIAEDLQLLSPVNAIKQQQQREAQGLPPPPTPEQVAAQQTAEIEREKLALEQERERAKIDLEREKAAAQMQMEREKFAHQMDLERQKIAAQIAMEREKARALVELKREEAGVNAALKAEQIASDNKTDTE